MMKFPLDAAAPPARQGSDHEPAPTYRFERRSEDRWPASGFAVAHLVSGDRFGERCPLRLCDESREGVGALSNRAVEPGTPVTLGFSEPAQPFRSGVVLRCLACEEGYRIAIRFERRMAA